MSRQLLIFRHGKSDWGSDALGDFGRPLAPRGRKAVKRMGRWLLGQKLLPEQIVSSPAKRAKQTAKRLCRHAEISESVISWDEAIYEADVETLLGVLAECDPSSKRLMIVGHNPGLEELVEYLVGEPVAAPLQSPVFPTAALAHLSMPEDWTRLERGCARLIALTRPRELES